MSVVIKQKNKFNKVVYVSKGVRSKFHALTMAVKHVR